jgi:hypothetical protein
VSDSVPSVFSELYAGKFIAVRIDCTVIKTLMIFLVTAGKGGFATEIIMVNTN